MSRSDKFALLGGELHSRPERAPRPVRQEKAPLHQPDLFDYVPPVRKTHLLPEEAPLLTVTNRAFGETERDDGWLYLLLPVELGWALIEAGLPLDPRSPISLSERSALPPLFHLSLKSIRRPNRCSFVSAKPMLPPSWRATPI